MDNRDPQLKTITSVDRAFTEFLDKQEAFEQQRKAQDDAEVLRNKSQWKYLKAWYKNLQTILPEILTLSGLLKFKTLLPDNMIPPYKADYDDMEDYFNDMEDYYDVISDYRAFFYLIQKIARGDRIKYNNRFRIRISKDDIFYHFPEPFRKYHDEPYWIFKNVIEWNIQGRVFEVSHSTNEADRIQYLYISLTKKSEALFNLEGLKKAHLFPDMK